MGGENIGRIRTEYPDCIGWVQTKQQLPAANFGCGDGFRWSVERVGKPHFTYVIAAVNELVAPFHDRMPMILSPADYAKWFDANTTLADLRALLKPNRAKLVVSEASPFFKSPKNEGPRLLDLAA